MTTVTLQLKPETEQKLRERADHAGQTLEAYLQQLAEREAKNGTPMPTSQRTFDEILAPVRKGFAESGMSDDELDALLKEARDEVWRAKQKGQG
jgi:hypothetical protein